MFRLSKSKNVDFLFLYKKAKKIYDDVPYIRRKRRQRKMFVLLKYFSFFVLFFLFFLAIIFAFYFGDLKVFYNSAKAGKDNIERSIVSLQNGEYEEGGRIALLAQENFAEASQIADKYNSSFLFAGISYLGAQSKDLQYLVHSAELISKAVAQVSQFAQALEGVLVEKEKNFNNLSQDERRVLLDTIYKSSPELTGIKANIDLALVGLSNIGYSGILSPFQEKITEIESRLLKVEENLDFVIPLSNFLPVVLGYPEEASYLLLLQNSDELRPTGGFIGTYGILETYIGDINKLETHDVYHLDMPVKDLFSKKPPEALQKYLGVDKWYFRDSNWSPDWPTAAKEMMWFFEAENSLLPEKNKASGYEKEFDGVVGITPDLITDILSLVGPVYIEGEEFNSENFVELLEYKVEQEYIKLGIKSWHRKEVIGEIVKELKKKIFDLDPVNMYQMLGILNKNLLEKNILLYFKDQGFQEIAQEKGWTGEIKQYDSDYLFVVDSNMASYKTDAVINRSMVYSMAESSGNELISDLRLNYSHFGGFDWRTTRYRTYTRVYVPRGSQLINISGIENDSLKVYDESGKTVYAFFLKIEPGNIANVQISYKLPELVEKRLKNGDYALYIQKQPGKYVEPLKVDLDFKKEISSYQPTGFYANLKNQYTIEWDGDLKSDRTYIVKFKN